MCFRCDTDDGLKITESTGSTRHYREECERRDVHAEDTPGPMLDVIEAIQGLALMVDSVADTHPQFRPFFAAACATYAAAFDEMAGGQQ